MSANGDWSVTGTGCDGKGGPHVPLSPSTALPLARFRLGLMRAKLQRKRAICECRAFRRRSAQAAKQLRSTLLLYLSMLQSSLDVCLVFVDVVLTASIAKTRKLGAPSLGTPPRHHLLKGHILPHSAPFYLEDGPPGEPHSFTCVPPAMNAHPQTHALSRAKSVTCGSSVMAGRRLPHDIVLATLAPVWPLRNQSASVGRVDTQVVCNAHSRCP